MISVLFMTNFCNIHSSTDNSATYKKINKFADHLMCNSANITHRMLQSSTMFVDIGVPIY